MQLTPGADLFKTERSASASANGFFCLNSENFLLGMDVMCCVQLLYSRLFYFYKIIMILYGKWFTQIMCNYLSFIKVHSLKKIKL